MVWNDVILKLDLRVFVEWQVVLSPLQSYYILQLNQVW